MSHCFSEIEVVIVFQCFALPGPDTPGFSPDTPGLMFGVSGLSPGVSGFWQQTHFLDVNNPSYAFRIVFWCTHTHPTVNYIKNDFDLYCFAIIWHLRSQIWNSKFLAHIKGGSLYTSELHLFWVSNAVYGVVINHQKGEDWKVSRP